MANEPRGVLSTAPLAANTAVNQTCSCPNVQSSTQAQQCHTMSQVSAAQYKPKLSKDH